MIMELLVFTVAEFGFRPLKIAKFEFMEVQDGNCCRKYSTRSDLRRIKLRKQEHLHLRHAKYQWCTK